MSAIALLSRRIVAALSQDPPDLPAYRRAWTVRGIGAPGHAADPQIAGSLLAAWANGSYLLVDAADPVLAEQTPQTMRRVRQLYQAAAAGDPRQLESVVLAMLFTLDPASMEQVLHAMAMGYVVTARCCGGLTRLLDVRSVTDQVAALDGDRSELANLASLVVAATSGPDRDHARTRLLQGLHLVAGRPGGDRVLSELAVLLVRVTARIWESSAAGRATGAGDPRFPPLPGTGPAASLLEVRAAVASHLGQPGKPAPPPQAIQFRGSPAEITAEQIDAILWAGLAAGLQVDAVIAASWQRQSNDLDPDHRPQR